MRVRIHETPFRYCQAIAHARVHGHIAKGSKTGPEDLEKRLLLETRATICEFAFSLLTPSLKGHFRGDVDLRGDGGWDYQLPNGRRVDIKSGPPQANSMIVNERHLREHSADTYIMSRFLDRIQQVEFMGWINAKDIPIVGKPGALKTWGNKPHIIVLVKDLKPMVELEL